MRVLGVDPGTWRMGYGALEERDGEVTALEYGVLRPRGTLPLEQRLLHLYEALRQVVARLRPDQVAVEEPFVSRGEEGNMRTAVAVGQAQAVALMAAAAAGAPVHRYPPASVKQAIANYGGGTKEQVAAMVQMLLRLPEPPQPLDAADALAVALCHLRERAVEALVVERPS